MALVDYSSSDDETEARSKSRPAASPECLNPLKRKLSPVTSVKDPLPSQSTTLPPLPSKFHDLYASTVRTSTRDDPSQHSGRKRITPHREGNWPSHLYIEWYPSTDEVSLLQDVITTVSKKSASANGQKTKTEREGEETVHTFLKSDLGAPLPLHISLSRPIGFPTEKKDHFLSSLQRVIASSTIRPFEITTTSLDWVSNLEKTRWFLVLRLQKPNEDGLNRLLRTCNRVVEEYGQPPLYMEAKSKASDAERGNGKRIGLVRRQGMIRNAEEGGGVVIDLSDTFHVSIAWRLQPPNEEEMETVKEMTQSLLFKELTKVRLMVQEIKAKIGNVVTSIELPLKSQEQKGLFGF